ncbi:hypothetical protein [Oceanirhabdus sp. W0125-5]|uniref:hypothetical protein n=1 Tax=Oceanirhabdus sp. W0125-5 TaxID=2999116 RepID=UPI0022F305E4|nr:hypothetical protein [Oceanirhabdus sp. W0125-5]WBW95193.1 hypothetical protein OW730_16030 [Oceanirhabdus sp. W0125-5]
MNENGSDRYQDRVVKTKKKGVVMTELLKNAFTGINIIPTVLLIIVFFYWISVIFGALGFDFLDFDLDGVDNSGPFYSVLSFLNLAEVPFMLVFSILILNFWIIAMLMYYLPIAPGGPLNAVLLLPGLGVSMFITKYETIPLKGLFNDRSAQEERGSEVIEHQCILKCDVENGRLGQAEIEREGASIVINVKSEFLQESFHRGEVAFVIRKDTDKNIYYIVKMEEKKNELLGSDTIS